MTNETDLIETRNSKKSWRPWVYGLILVYILAAGAYLRLVGLDWDEDQHLHPDERFLTMVEAALEPVDSLGGYFDTANSTLNPNNRGYGFFVYGTLPIFIVRYAAEWLGQTGYGEVYLVGRALSALADLLVVVLVYLVAMRLYDRRVGVLAAAFSAFAVLQIQQSHFFTVDTFTNFFMMLAVYFAVAVSGQRGVENGEQSAVGGRWSFVLFGLALGMAVASKINAAPIALMLPGAAVLYLLSLPPGEQKKQGVRIFAYLVLAAGISIIAFRVFQPYAFSGPGFFGVKPNEMWVGNMKSLKAQTSGDVDFPPALQWARRPVWFSLQNLVMWGLGLPLGVLAWISFLWMGWRMLKGEWKPHILLWGWTALYFVWQSLQWNSTMRYQLPIYPTLAIFAAWLVVWLYDAARKVERSTFNVKRFLVILLGGAVLVMTFAWGFAFTRIYTRPHTRVEATRWMFQNMPGPVTLAIRTEDGIYNQPLSFPQDLTIGPEYPYEIRFTTLADGELTDLNLPHVVDRTKVSNLSLLLTLTSLSGEGEPLAAEIVSSAEIPDLTEEARETTIFFNEPAVLNQGKSYHLTFGIMDGYGDVKICGPLTLQIQTLDGSVDQLLPAFTGCLGRVDLPYPIEFIASGDGILRGVALEISAEKPVAESSPQTLAVTLIDPNGQSLTTETLTADFSPADDLRGAGYHILLSQGIPLIKGETYTLRFALQSGNGAIALSGVAIANESSWDDGLPLRMDGYDPYGGIYQGGLNFEMYWDDNEEQLDRFVTTLDQADYVLITSSRQWASTTRVPERYPLTTEYYRHLLGCPVEHTIEWCGNVAQPGTFQGDLGFELVKVFQSNPSLGDFEINDQFSEEAFTVYDHPKVFVFQKSADYDPGGVREILGTVDLSKVIRITPKQADSYPGNLLLPPDRLEEQRSGGTWSDFFDPQAPQNRFEIIGVLLWYVSVSLVGLIAYPLVRFALPGLSDHGYPLARITGLLLLSNWVWLAGSARVPFNRLTIGMVLVLMALLGGYLAYRQRDELRQEWRSRRNYFLLVEGLILAFFLLGLLIRWGNPDLWHPWKGGEKPMDFSYFNAVLKSTSFPPYDPWFAGGYINYYYYGFMLVGVLVKFLGIVPSFAYNLILPTLFSLFAIGAFSVAWNLFGKGNRGAGGEGQGARGDESYTPHPAPRTTLRALSSIHPAQLVSGLSAALGMAFLGNLGTLRMIFRGFQKNATPGGEIESVGFISKLVWTVLGFFKTLLGTPLPIRMDEWYWNPSRVIGSEHGSPITEFPFFTFLYADLHAHLIALPVALLVLAWVVSVVRGRAWQREEGRSVLQAGLGLFIGGLAIGALYPTNLSDIYTYLPLGAVALGYAVWRYVDVKGLVSSRHDFPDSVKRWLLTGLSIAVLVALSRLLYQPYWHWYGQGYSDVQIWPGTHTPISDYLTHWGLFLFLIVSWMFYETIHWMAGTPVSSLRKLEPYWGLIWGGVVILVVLILALGITLYPEGLPPGKLPLGLGVHVTWLVLPLVAWVGVLLLRPGLSDSKRMVLFLVGTALLLTLMVEIVVVSGDIGRMNTVFKFYLHTWTLLAVSSGAALGWLLLTIQKWEIQWRTLWQLVLGFLVVSAALYPLLGSVAKIKDRMEVSTPYTLDGMAYMQYATYHDEGVAMDLSQDYNAIRWLQENVSGSPVIVEANQVEYHWGTRYTIYTGLPGVVGWNWHQRQQRTVTPHDWVFERVDAVHEFYQTEDLQKAQDFLRRYEVRYIIFGQLEQAKYAGPGLEKFSAQEGVLWTEIFRDRDTVIYEVIRD